MHYKATHSVPLMILTLLYCSLLSGCGENAAEAPVETEEVVYVCSETGDVVVAPPQAIPAVHPQTNRATLLRGLYCPKCEKWHPIPPPDVYNRNPLGYRCPEHETAMKPDGPLPTKS